MWDTFKTTIIAILSVVMAYLEPVHNTMTVLLIMALIDIFAGFITGIAVDGERFRFRKFMMAAVYLLVYLVIIALIHTVSLLQGDHQAGMLIVKSVTYIFIYFYSTNILRNLQKLFPANRILAFLYHIVGMEFAKKIPYLGEWLNKEETNTQNYETNS